MSVILPYRNQGESISVNLDFPGTETSKLSETSILVDRSKLHGPFQIRIEAQLPDSIEDAFPPTDRGNPPIAVVAKVLSIDALMRWPVALKPSKKNLYAGSITIDPSVVSESAHVQVFAVRKVVGNGGGFAKQKGSRIAWSPVNEIRLMEKPPPRGRYLRIVWEDFENSAVVPSVSRSAFHYVHTSSEEPVLYLNKQAKAPLVKLVDTRGHGHAKALPRDVIFTSIAIPVWTSLVHAALLDLKKEGDTGGYPVDFEDTFGGSWKGDVLKWISERVFPDMLPESALFEFCSKMGEDDFFANVVARAQIAIQSEQKLLKTYDEFGEREFANG
jgi:hypothetical protein